MTAIVDASDKRPMWRVRLVNDPGANTWLFAQLADAEDFCRRNAWKTVSRHG